jgi:hypothetical protein
MKIMTNTSMKYGCVVIYKILPAGWCSNLEFAINFSFAGHTTTAAAADGQGLHWPV